MYDWLIFFSSDYYSPNEFISPGIGNSISKFQQLADSIPAWILFSP